MSSSKLSSYPGTAHIPLVHDVVRSKPHRTYKGKIPASSTEKTDSGIRGIVKKPEIDNLTTLAVLEKYLRMLPSEISLQILSYCNLETCLSYCDTCTTLTTLIKSIDSSFVRQKVLERVPWMQLDDEDDKFNTWLKCARIIRARNKATSRDHYISGTDFLSLFPKCVPNEKFLDPSHVTHLPETFKPVFEQTLMREVDGERVYLRGSRVVSPDPDPNPENDPNPEHRNHGNDPHPGPGLGTGTGTGTDPRPDPRPGTNPNPGVNPNPTTNPNPNGNHGNPLILSSTPMVAHIRTFDTILPCDYLAYRPTLTLSPSIFDQYQVVIKLPSFENFCVPFVHLIPHSSKAILGIHVKSDAGILEKEEQTFVYLIDSNCPLKVVLICILPSRPIKWREILRENWRREIDSMVPSRDFDVAFFHGLLYIYCKGRLVPLWIDIEDDVCDDETPFASPDSYLGMFPRTRVRVWFDTKKHVICTVSGYLPCPRVDSLLVQNNRYITLSGTGGSLVGDLNSDVSYIVRNVPWSGSLIWVGLEDGKVVFYSSSEDSGTRYSDSESRLGIYSNWEQIVQHGWGFHVRDLGQMVPNYRQVRMEIEGDM